MVLIHKGKLIDLFDAGDGFGYGYGDGCGDGHYAYGSGDGSGDGNEEDNGLEEIKTERDFYEHD